MKSIHRTTYGLSNPSIRLGSLFIILCNLFAKYLAIPNICIHTFSPLIKKGKRMHAQFTHHPASAKKKRLFFAAVLLCPYRCIISWQSVRNNHIKIVKQK